METEMKRTRDTEGTGEIPRDAGRVTEGGGLKMRMGVSGWEVQLANGNWVLSAYTPEQQQKRYPHLVVEEAAS